MLPAQAAMAGLVKKADGTKPSESKADRAIEQLVDLVNQAFDTQTATEDVEGNLPMALVQIVRGYYGQAPAKADGKLNELRGVAKKFDQRWAAYQTRIKEVDKTLKKAASLKREGFLTDARDVLIDGVTAVDRADDGTIPQNRDMLEVRDAELPILIELGGILEELKEFNTLFEVGAAMEGRRKVYDVEEERLLWVASQKNLAPLAKGQKPEIADGLNYVADRVEKARSMGHMLSYGLWRKINGGMLKIMQPADPDSAEVDDHVIFAVTPDRVTDTNATYYKDGSFDIDRDCYETDRIDGIDYRTGRIYYRVLCSKQHVTVNIRVDVEFATPPEGWAKRGPVYIVGRIASKNRVNGVQWKIEDAAIPDTRYIGR
jgi:hypothetical protein